MFLLRHPYLTLEQDKGHSLALGKAKDWMNQKMLEKAAKKVRLSTRFEDKFAPLCHSTRWEL